MLVGHLLNAGYHVRVIDIGMFGFDGLDKYRDRPYFDLIPDDYRSDNMERHLRSCFAVIHLAAIVGDPACSREPKKSINVNQLGLRGFMKRCERAGVKRFVLASTCSVYGSREGLCKEGSELNPQSLYAQTKIGAEKIVLKYEGATALRFGTLFGWSTRMRYDLIVNTFVHEALHNGVIKVFGGEQGRPFIHVIDVSKIIIGILKAPGQKINKEIFNLVGHNIKIKDLAELVRKELPHITVKFNGNGKDTRSYMAHPLKLVMAHLAIFSNTDLENGIKEMIHKHETN